MCALLGAFCKSFAAEVHKAVRGEVAVLVLYLRVATRSVTRCDAQERTKGELFVSTTVFFYFFLRVTVFF